jgi:hypothetical protein
MGEGFPFSPLARMDALAFLAGINALAFLAEMDAPAFVRLAPAVEDEAAPACFLVFCLAFFGGAASANGGGGGALSMIVRLDCLTDSAAEFCSRTRSRRPPSGLGSTTAFAMTGQWTRTEGVLRPGTVVNKIKSWR